MLRKKEVYTNITPIPSHIPRQLAVDILHSHEEIITLNPLVVEHKPIPAPRDADADEFYSTWYEIVERIQYVPGVGKLGSGRISFKGCFHDMPWGLQTHTTITTPMYVDLRNIWRIAGNEPGEPAEARELGIGAPKEGLYLREDIEIKCNITLVSFVKAQLRAASKVLVDRLIRKAELLDAGVLHAMMDNGRLKTINPNDRSKTFAAGQVSPGPASPRLPYNKPSIHGNAHRPASYQQLPSGPEQQHNTPHHAFSELAAPDQPQSQSFVAELPGDYYSSPPPQQQQSRPQSDEASHLQPPRSPYLNQQQQQSHPPSYPRDSTYSDATSTSGTSPNPSTGTSARWSDYQSNGSSRPTSYASDAGSGMKSPGLPSEQQHNRFAPGELPTMKETREEYDAGWKGRKTDSPIPVQEQEPRYKYNPQDFVRGGHPPGYVGQ